MRRYLLTNPRELRLSLTAISIDTDWQRNTAPSDATRDPLNWAAISPCINVKRVARADVIRSMKITYGQRSQGGGMAERGVDGIAIGLLDTLGKQLWGFTPRLAPSVVAELGPVGALRWFAANMPRYASTLRVLGPLRTHLACTVTSLHNGCRYSSFGHAYAVERVYLEQRERVFPVDAHTICGWTGLAPGEQRDRVCDALERAGLHAEVIWVDRTLALASGQQRPVDRHEARIAHLVRMFGLLNALGVADDIAPDEAPEPLNTERRASPA
jgi:hypothetical protein